MAQRIVPEGTKLSNNQQEIMDFFDTLPEGKQKQLLRVVERFADSGPQIAELVAAGMSEKSASETILNRIAAEEKML